MFSTQIQRLIDCFDNDRATEKFDAESDSLRKEIYLNAFKEYSNEPRNIQIAKAFSLFLAQKRVWVREFDLLAGNMQHYDLRPSVPVTPVKYPSATQAGDARLSIDECKPYLPGSRGNEGSEGNESNEESQGQVEELYRFVDAMESGLFTHTANGHVTSGFNYFVKTGYPEYRRQIMAELQKTGRPQDEMDELNGMLITIDAVIDYHNRYADAAFDMAKQTGNKDYRSNLLRIGHACQTLAQGPPETFFEALQGILLLQELLTMESAAISMSIGRLDQILHPFFRQGGLSFDEAQDLIYAFNIKLASLVESYQNVVICGVDADGGFAGNEVSLMLLRAAKNLSYDQPLLCMRYTEDLPEGFWEEALDTIASGHGFPAIFNDKVVMASKRILGIEPEDLWDYAVSGCVEMSYGGRELCNTELLRVNWLKVLELVLNEGYCNSKNRSFEMAEKIPLDSITCFEQLKERFKRELEHFIRIGTDACSKIESVYYKCYPSQLLSITVDGCIAKGREASNLGAKYSFSAINNAGMANVVDSLLAIKKIVFDEKMMTLKDFAGILNEDFAGNEQLRAYCINKCEKFGNNLEESDMLMQELVDHATAYESSIPNLRGGSYMPGAYTVTFHAHMGACTGASADGRKKGYPLSNSLCPVQGVDVAGPTAVVNSVTSCNHDMFSNGMVLDLKFNSSFLNNNAHRDMLRKLIETYFMKGGMEIQFNIVDRETLLKAQEAPEEYRNLLIRVSGFSAYFVTLHKQLQDEIIARTEYA